MFSYGKIPDDSKVSCAVFYLRDSASYWWDTIVSVHDVTTITWERFRELFDVKYITKTARVAKRKEFANLKQGDMSVDEYYRKFVEGFSKIASPLTNLTRKNVKFQWTDSCERSFMELKQRLVSALILAIPTGSGGLVVYSDASK